MDDQHKKRCGIVRMVIGAVAVAFGLLTIKSGGDVLFWSEEARIAAGDYVPAVLWFNFISGFIYVAVGMGFWLKKPWAAWLAIMVAISTIMVFATLLLSIQLSDIAYETRTIGAMTLRSVVWLVLSFLAYKSITKGDLHEH